MNRRTGSAGTAASHWRRRLKRPRGRSGFWCGGDAFCDWGAGQITHFNILLESPASGSSARAWDFFGRGRAASDKTAKCGNFAGIWRYRGRIPLRSLYMKLCKFRLHAHHSWGIKPVARKSVMVSDPAHLLLPHLRIGRSQSRMRIVDLTCGLTSGSPEACRRPEMVAGGMFDRTIFYRIFLGCGWE